MRYSLNKLLALLLFVSLCWGGSTLISAYEPLRPTPAKSPADSGYAGSAACFSCHRELVEGHRKTAHYLTSRLADSTSIKGNFTAGNNELNYNPFIKVVIEKQGDHYVQSSRINDQESQSAPFDIVIGSGRKGQTYLFWNNDQLFQLPVSYYTPGHSWVISPSYPLSVPRYDRIIPGHCMECHSTNARMIPDGDNQQFVKNSIIYGVDCERCHGPGAQHVEFQLANPSEKSARFITGPAKLTRQRQLDACALCHSGFRKELRPPFSFRTGDTLDQFSTATYSEDTAAALDVHGNQYGLLTSSKCFRMSEMTCSSCHNVHKEEVNAPDLFSQRCQGCHQQTVHKFAGFPATAVDIKTNCISCHMPMLPSKNIFLVANDRDKSSPDFVRTHRVAIYPDQTRAYLNDLNKNNKKRKKKPR